MGLLNGFKNWIVGDEEYEDEVYEEENMQEAEEEYQHQQYSSSRQERASAPAVRESSAVSQQRGNRIVNINATTKLAVVLVRAEQFNSVVDIADHLKNKMTVVLNLESTEKDVATRMLDFLSGVTYALEGKVKRVAKSTYLITPYNVEIVGEDLISELESNGLRFGD